MGLEEAGLRSGLIVYALVGQSAVEALGRALAADARWSRGGCPHGRDPDLQC